MNKDKKYVSILDYNKTTTPAIPDDFSNDIKMTFEAILNNLNIITYFNIICFDLYGVEFDKIEKNYQIKIDDGEDLNLTYLEILYNLIAQIHLRKLKYTDRVGYDLYILPLKIKKYLQMNGYDLINYENDRGFKVFKLEAIEDIKK